jgi:hypothetical protein
LATPGQQRLWDMVHSYSSPEVHNLLHCYHVYGRIDRSTFEGILRQLLRKYPIFRVAFRTTEQGLVMHTRDSDPQLHFEKARSDDLHNQLAADVASTRFRFTDGNLLRFYLFQIDPAYHVFFILTHHLVSDGISGSILEEEVFRAHDEHERGAHHTTMDQDLGFFQWCDTVTKLTASDDLLRYWQEKLSGKPLMMRLPSVSCDHLAPSFVCQRTAISLEASLLLQARQFCIRKRITLFALCAAVFNWNLAAWCDTRCSTVQIQVSGRHESEYDSAMGFFSNYAFLTSDFQGGVSFADYVAELWSDMLDIYAHQAAPHEIVVRNLKADYRHLRSVLYWFENFSEGSPHRTQHGVTFRAFPQPERTVYFYDLTLACLPAGGSMTIAALFNQQKFHSAQMQRLLDRILCSFQLLIDSPNTTFDRWLNQTLA